MLKKPAFHWLKTAIASVSLMLASASVACAINPFDYENFNFDKPVLSYEEFRELLADDNGVLPQNPLTGQPMPEAELKKYWNKMLTDDPSLRPFLDGRYDLMPGRLHKLPDDVISDIESILHSVISLKDFSSLTNGDDIQREGRRIARALQQLDGGRLARSVSEINQLEPIEARLILQSIGTSADAINRILSDRRVLQDALVRLPESSEALKNLGGAETIVKTLRKLRVPTDQTGSRIVDPTGISVAVKTRSAGGVFAIALPAIQLLSPIGGEGLPADGITEEGKVEAPYQAPVSPSASTTNTGATEDFEDAPNAVYNVEASFVDPANEPQLEGVAEVEEELEKPAPDDKPEQCPSKNTNELKKENLCGAVDIKDHKNFVQSLKDANKALEGIDVTLAESDMDLMRTAVDAFDHSKYDMAYQQDRVLSNAKNVEKFGDMSLALDKIIATVPAEKRAPFELLKLQHNEIFAGYQAVLDSAKKSKQEGIVDIFRKCSNSQGAIHSSYHTLNAIANLPKPDETILKQMESASGAFNTSCTGEALDELEQVDKKQREKKKVSEVAGKLANKLSGVVGASGLVKLLQDIQRIATMVEMVKSILDTVKEINQMADNLKKSDELNEMAKAMGDTQSAAKTLSESSEEIENLKGKMTNIDVDAIKTVQGCMQEVAQKLDGKLPFDPNAEMPTEKDMLSFSTLLKETDNYVRTVPELRQKFAGEWTKVVESTNAFTTLTSNSNYHSFVATQRGISIGIGASFNLKSRDLQAYTDLSRKIPQISGKIRNIPAIKNATNKVSQQIAKLSGKLDSLRKPICFKFPKYSVRYCLKPFIWPISQGHIFGIIGNYLSDKRYGKVKNLVGALPIDMSRPSGLFANYLNPKSLKGAVISGSLGFGVEEVTPGMSGAVSASEEVRVINTPAISPLNLNEGGLLETACPRPRASHGLLIDEFNEPEFEGSPNLRTDPNSGYKRPEFAYTNMLEPMLNPQVRGVSSCAPIQAVKCPNKTGDCYPPFFRRLMLDSCANQYIVSQSMYPTYISDKDSKLAVNEKFCMPLRIIPVDDCAKDEQGRCLKDKERKGKGVMHEYSAFEYLRRAWYGTLIHNYFPDVFYPKVPLPGESTKEKETAFKQEIERAAEKSKQTGDINSRDFAQIQAPGIDHYVDQSAFGRAKKIGPDNFLDKDKRWQVNDLVSFPYQRIYDVTHPFSPRWDFESNDRERYRKCVVLSARTQSGCGPRNIMPFIGAGYPEMGEPLACAATPVDIMRFRAKRFDNCIMCRIKTNEKCLWSEVWTIVVTSLIMEVLRWVVYILGNTLCLGIDECGKFLRGLVDKTILNPMGHNAKKDLSDAPKTKREKKCNGKCQKFISPYEAALLVLQNGDKGGVTGVGTGGSSTTPSQQSGSYAAMNNSNTAQSQTSGTQAVSNGSANNKALAGNPYDTEFFRMLTGTYSPDMYDSNAASKVDEWKTRDWKKDFESFKKEDNGKTYKDSLEPYAKIVCPPSRLHRQWQLCVPARFTLRMAFKGAVKKARRAVEKGVSKLKGVSFCKSDKTKQGRDQWPPCSTRFDESDKDEKFCKKMCKVSLQTCCNDLAKPLVPINVLKMAGYEKDEDKPGAFGEGMTFKEYFGNHRPYMRLWDTGSEYRGIGMKPKMTDMHSDFGSRIYIVGVGQDKNNSCKIGGWGYDPSNPSKRFLGNNCVKLPNEYASREFAHPLTSWTELKLYQARTYRQFRLNCLADPQKLFKSLGTEDLILRSLGGRVTVQSENGQHTINWPLAHRGFLWDPRPEFRFPNVGQRGQAKVLQGLDNVKAGDIIFWDADVFKEAFPTNPRASQEFKPMMGVVVSSFSKQNAEQINGTPDEKKFSVTVRITDSGMHPDACGYSDMIGNTSERQMFKYQQTLLSNDNRAIRAKFKAIETAARNQTNAVYETRCHIDPMLSSCTLEDSKADKPTSLWDKAKIYRPYDDDYRGGCEVRRNVKSTEHVDMNTLSGREMLSVPAEDLLKCYNDGKDPPKSFRMPTEDLTPQKIHTGFCAPGFSGTADVTQRQSPMRNNPFAALMPSMRNKPDPRLYGCPRFATSKKMQLQLKLHFSANFPSGLRDVSRFGAEIRSVHDAAAGGMAGLEKFYQFINAQPPLVTSKVSLPFSGNGAIPTLYCGGAVSLSGGAAPRPTNSRQPPTPFTIPYAGNMLQESRDIPLGTTMKLFLPPKLLRNRSLGQDEELNTTDMNMNRCPGFSITGIKADEANLIFPGCKNPDECPPTPIQNGNVQTDGEMMIATPPDSALQINEGSSTTLYFPNGLSFRHECQEMVDLDYAVKVNLNASGQLKVLEGEGAAVGKLYPLRNYGGVYELLPKGGFIPAKGLVVPLNLQAKLIPALNIMPAPLFDASNSEEMPVRPGKPQFESTEDDGEDQKAYDEKSTDPDMNSLIGTVNDICKLQRKESCPDGTPGGAWNDQNKELREEGGDEAVCADPNSEACKIATQGRCTKADSNTCTLQQINPCIADKASNACSDYTTFCATVPSHWSCSSTFNMKNPSQSTLDALDKTRGPEYDEIISVISDSCSKVNRAGGMPAGCQGFNDFCAANPENYVCAGGN